MNTVQLKKLRVGDKIVNGNSKKPLTIADTHHVRGFSLFKFKERPRWVCIPSKAGYVPNKAKHLALASHAVE